MNYWDERYTNERMIWGAYPSKTVVKAEEHFAANGCKKIIVPGCGYGRNSNFFDKKGYQVTGVDVSQMAISMAKSANNRVTYLTGSFLDLDLADGSFDGLYTFNVLHLFMQEERKRFTKKVFDLLKSGGIAFFTVFSDEERSFGQGNETEPSTFESKPGRPVHYFTRNDLLNHFTMQTVLDEGTVEENEVHGSEGEHIHLLRYIIVKG
jgi:SAM-dependent methyltransferase